MNIGENIAHTNNATKATIKRTTPIIKIIEKTNPIIAVIIWHITDHHLTYTFSADVQSIVLKIFSNKNMGVSDNLYVIPELQSLIGRSDISSNQFFIVSLNPFQARQT